MLCKFFLPSLIANAEMKTVDEKIKPLGTSDEFNY